MILINLINLHLLLQANFQSLDRQETERINAKNALEEYIYDMRNKLETMSEFFEPASIETLNAKLNVAQNWLDDDGYDSPRPGMLHPLTRIAAILIIILFRVHFPASSHDRYLKPRIDARKGT